MRLRIAYLIAGVLVALVSAQAAGNDAVLGKWVTQNGKPTVEVYACGPKLCGKIVALKNPLYTDASEGPAGTPKVDRKNPDVKLRTRPLLELQLLDGFVAAGNGAWSDGTIYDPDSGKTYKCKLSSRRRGSLRFAGLSESASSDGRKSGHAENLSRALSRHRVRALRPG
jgi:uncharacterized protein (DUF2147 family)